MTNKTFIALSACFGCQFEASQVKLSHLVEEEYTKNHIDLIYIVCLDLITNFKMLRISLSIKQM